MAGSKMVSLSTSALEMLDPILSSLTKHYLKLQNIYLRAKGGFLYLIKSSVHQMANIWPAWQSHRRLSRALGTFAFMSFYFHKNK